MTLHNISSRELREKKTKKDREHGRVKHKSDRFLKRTAAVLSIIFAALMLYPFLFALSCSMKDNSKIYEVPLKLLPAKANSISIVLDYSDLEIRDEAQQKDLMMQDSILTMFSVSYKMPDASVMEIQIYGVRDGKTLFHSRAHQMKLQMERDYGIYASTAIKKEVLLHEDRYVRACESIGYEYSAQGLSYGPEGDYDEAWTRDILDATSEKYETVGKMAGVIQKTNNLLNLESFKYYLQMPAYIYPGSPQVVRLGFFAFVLNSIIVIGFAMIAQVILCSVCAFVISRQLSQRAGRFVLLFFMGGMMIPFASIMLPQLIMYRQMGAYNNYAALLLPFLYPYGFYVYLYKGFFDQIPGSYFEAAALDGAGSLYLYREICMPLSKPIISLIALQTFIGNWNDFFWAWLVTEDQKLWTLNVALYNISNNMGTKQNALMGLSILTITPVMLVSILFSKQLKQSIAASGIKG